MRKINNPYNYLPNYNCFACSPFNTKGLKMIFWEEEEEILCNWVLDKYFQGYPGILHGGIQATLLDEISSWLVNVKLKTAGFTEKLNVQYIKPVRLNEGEAITLRAKLVEVKDNIAIVNALLFNKSGVLCTQAEVHYFIYPENIAKKKFNYPGYEAFINDDIE
ncbi:MAG TPA: PaaI family thioesterase [Bacteroidales bacterium]|mgnify:CR=1 FL=1|nr:PaaI family thioesterase [Bacteroidales bacterium]